MAEWAPLSPMTPVLRWGAGESVQGSAQIVGLAAASGYREEPGPASLSP